MCGIVGYVGQRDAVPVILEGLGRLEYRGYDSAGLAVISNGALEMRRSVGKLVNLSKAIKAEPLAGRVGVGHTRWATHGRPSEENAHPHTDCKGRMVVVHNGIIENYLSLKERLQGQGHVFKSETDTEVLAHLIEQHMRGNLFEAVRLALQQVEGSYAIGVVSLDNPERVVAARRGSPLVAGVGDGEFFVASDIPAILKATRRVIFLEDGELCVLGPSGVEVKDGSGKTIPKRVTQITWSAAMAEKAGFKHFMLKEIHEQPQAVEDTFRGRLRPDAGEVDLPDLGLTPEQVRGLEKVFLVACGTSYHAGLVARYWLEEEAGIPCEVDIASEFRYRNPIIPKHSLAVVITQSGETADTLAALREAKLRGARTLAVCNVVGSTAAREADGVVYTHCGPEIGVASTKAFTGQLTALLLLTVALGRARSRMGVERAREILRHLLALPAALRAIVATQAPLKDWARRFGKCADFLYLGRHVNYPIALEGALKLKEISYIHAEGYPAGEMKHGPIALIDKNLPVLTIATQSKVYPKVLSNIEEAHARDGIILALATSGDKEIRSKARYVYDMPPTLEILTPIQNVVPLQLLAYHIAVRRKCDVDKPRNLAKSVTVE